MSSFFYFYFLRYQNSFFKVKFCLQPPPPSPLPSHFFFQNLTNFKKINFNNFLYENTFCLIKWENQTFCTLQTIDISFFFYIVKFTSDIYSDSIKREHFIHTHSSTPQAILHIYQLTFPINNLPYIFPATLNRLMPQ